MDLSKHGIVVPRIRRNPPPSVLYEEALRREHGSAISSTGALIAMSGVKTGRSPTDKRVVCNPSSEEDVWWGPVNIKIEPQTFNINRERALDYLNTLDQLFVIDGFAGWDETHRIRVRIVCERAYHALFMRNMLIRPSPEELDAFGDPDFVVFNAGRFPANRHTRGMTSKTSVAINFETRELVILGTEYAGEMKKGVFTIMNYLMPKRGILSMHCSANVGSDQDDVTIFFGLSGTGKTTLSADPNRGLVGDDEHCWHDGGIFNIEGGCYAKCINLSAVAEPEIYNAIRYGAVLENVVYDEDSREVDYTQDSITPNTRCSYPIEYIPNARLPAVAQHPRNIIFLTCDAFSVLPPVSRLTPGQAMYHFISGYTAKVAGTEVGVTEPQATFSSCFGAPFLVWHPTRYAELLAQRMKRHEVKVWMVNTGWSGGPYGEGQRMSIQHTRAIIDGIHSGDVARAQTVEDPVFGVCIPTACPGVPSEVLVPRNTWKDPTKYDTTARKLAGLFHENFKTFAPEASEEVRAAAPRA